MSLQSVDNILPLTSAQERFWLLDQFHPGNPAYSLVVAFNIQGRLNIPILEKSINFLVARHDALRTTFTTIDGAPKQCITAHATIKIECMDVVLDDGEDQARVVDAAIEKIVHQSFNLNRHPLSRFTVIGLRDDASILVVTQHHIISDGVSFDTLVEEIGSCYSAHVVGQQPNLPELAFSYADFTRQQNAWLLEQGQKERLAHWKSHLRNCPVLDLPADAPRPPRQTYSGASHRLNYPLEKVSRLQRLARANKASLFMVLHTAFNLLLSKLSGQRDFAIGTPHAARLRSDTQRVLGLFLNTLVIRAPITDQETFITLLSKVRHAALDAYDSVDIPLESILDIIHPDRDPSRPLLFQVLINMTSDQPPLPKLHDLQVSRVSYTPNYAKFDITLYLTTTSDHLELNWVYNSDLFSDTRIGVISQQFLYLLDQIIDNPDVGIDALSLVTPTTRPQLPDAAETLPAPTFPLVTELIEMWIEQSPQAPAIDEDGQIWSYAELSRQAAQIANALAMRGVAKGHVVAITGATTRHLIAAMIGVLRAGGILLTIDPALPEAHKSRMLKIARPRQLLTVGVDTKALNWARALPSFAVDRTLEAAGNADLPAPSANDSAYIFFTSGTTGEPKGIEGTHRGLSHFLCWQRDSFAVAPQDRCAQTTRISFDVVLRDVFLPLISGATLVISNRQTNHSDLLAWIGRKNITHFHTVPSLLAFWLTQHSSHASIPNSLKAVFIAGEPLDAGLVERCRDIWGSSPALVNLYGPTETTLAKSFYIVPKRCHEGIQPIGTALPQTQLLILNNGSKPCGVFEPGEICIRTPFRTRGYLQPAQSTFVDNPYSDVESDLLYRTGDIGWYLPNGAVAIGGRIDEQVKIRGVRIEPGAIANLLVECPGIENCCVIPIGESGEVRELAAYVVASSAQLTAATVKRYLEDQLPATHLPNTITFVEKIPLTANGKVDRPALPAPERATHTSDSPPDDEVERRLSRIWESVLGVSPIGVDDDFFSLGGHSLLAVRLVDRIRKTTGQDIPLATLLQASTIKSQAEILRSEIWKPNWASLVPMRTDGAKTPFFCFHAVGGNVLSLRRLAELLDDERPFYALQSQGLDGKQKIPSRVEEIAAYYIEEIRTVQPHGPYLIGGQSSGGIVAFEAAQQLQSAGESVSSLVLIDTSAPYRSAATLKQRLKFHTHNTRKGGLRYLSNFMVSRSTKLINRIQSFGERCIVSIAKRFYDESDRPLPTRIRPLYVRTALRKARSAYHPRVYHGPISLFSATDSFDAYLEREIGKRRSSWERLTEYELEVIAVKGEHNLERDPSVVELAAKLASLLNRTEETHYNQEKMSA